jgi:hypothetical protein
MAAPNSESNNIIMICPQGPDGLKIGDATTDKVAFFGSTPVVQQTGDTAITTTGMNTGTSGIFTTTTKSQAFIQAVMNIQTALKNLGLTT